jgi:DNA-binding CsgD family transcriptional regulator
MIEPTPLKHHLRLVELPASNVGAGPGKLAANERYAEFDLRQNAELVHYNWMASEVLHAESLFTIKDNQLTPVGIGDEVRWFKAVGDAYLRRQPTMLLLSGIHHKVPVLLQPHEANHIKVRLLTADMVAEPSFTLACECLKITVTEKAVLQLLLRGIQPKAVAKLTLRTESTVRSHIKGLLSKTGSNSLQEMITLFMRIPELGQR